MSSQTSHMPTPSAPPTSEQREAAERQSKALLITGGPGTGKSEVLALRCAHLIATGTQPERIAAIVPSVGQLSQLGSRLTQLCDRQITVFTPHQLAGQLVRRSALSVGRDPLLIPATRADRLVLMMGKVELGQLSGPSYHGAPEEVLARLLLRIDLLKQALIPPEEFAHRVENLPTEGKVDRRLLERERLLAELYLAHEKTLRENGVFDRYDLITRATEAVRTDSGEPGDEFSAIVVDDLQELGRAERKLAAELAKAAASFVAAGDSNQASNLTAEFDYMPVESFAEEVPGIETVELTAGLRCKEEILQAAEAVLNGDANTAPAVARPPVHRPPETLFWRCPDHLSQAAAVADEIAQTLAHETVTANQICVAVASTAHEGQALANELEVHGIPYRLEGSEGFYRQLEIRDFMAWLRLLIDPSDASAVTRALSRPPVELNSSELAACIQIARRRKLPLPAAAKLYSESDKATAEAQNKVHAFLDLYRSASEEFDRLSADRFVQRMVERLKLRSGQLLKRPEKAAHDALKLAELLAVSATYTYRNPSASPRDFATYLTICEKAGMNVLDGDHNSHIASENVGALPLVRVVPLHLTGTVECQHLYVLGLDAARIPGPRRQELEPPPGAETEDARKLHLAARRRELYKAITRSRKRLILSYSTHSEGGALQPPSQWIEAARKRLHGRWQDKPSEPSGRDRPAHRLFIERRDSLLEEIGRLGHTLQELRLDTEEELSRAVVRYLELVKLAAVVARPDGEDIETVLTQVNSRLQTAVTDQQRELFADSPLDSYLLDPTDRQYEPDIGGRDGTVSLKPFLPTYGGSLLLSASDIDTYRSCPLKYKFARVLKVPRGTTVQQRFGILIHQVLERFHASPDTDDTLAELLGLLEAGWRRNGLGELDEELRLRALATAALTRYHERLAQDRPEPVWVERQFAFKLDGYLIRGRIDRVDRTGDGGYELIDYKTGKVRKASELENDLQLSLYALAVRSAWQIEPAKLSYYYLIDDRKVSVPFSAVSEDRVKELARAVGNNIVAERFEPTPSYKACSMCDYRTACPVAAR